MEGKCNCGGGVDGWARILLLVACMAIAAGRAGGASATPGSAPAAAPDCTAAIGNLVDCLSFVKNGSTVEKPQGSCCSGLKMVLKTDASCLCEALKSSASFGVVLNLTKALSLPTACRVSSPSVSKCKIGGLGTAPAPAPHFFNPQVPASSPSAGGSAVGIPAPAPTRAAAPVVSVPSIAFLLAGVAVAAYFCF